jgi:hypothetical protein
VSKERALRRAERERQAASKAAARAREAERRSRSAARKQVLTGWLPRKRLMPGTLAARRRREVATTIAILVALNVLVWVVRPDWEARLGALVVGVLVAPVLHVMVVRR